MIARTWHGIVPAKHKAGFERYLDQTGVKEAKETPGNLGVYVQIADQDEFSHFFLCTVWDSLDSIASYAGNTQLRAITYPEDEQYELISDPIVVHQEVTTSKNPFVE